MGDHQAGPGTVFGERSRDPSQRRGVAEIVLQGVVTLFGLSLGLFALTRLAPGGPCAAYYGGRFSLSAAQHAVCVARFGLGQPIVIQYLLTIGGYLRGDFGFSINGDSVWSVIASQFPDSLLLVGSAIILQTLLAILIGLYVAQHRGGWVNRSVLALIEVIAGVPLVWFAYVLIIVLGVGLQWLPGGAEDIRLPIFWSGQWFAALPHHPGLLLGDQLRHLIIPLAATVLPGAAVSTLVVRRSILTALRQPSVVTARASGVPPSSLLVRLVLLGLIESAAPMFAALLGTASVVGFVADWRGDERLFWDEAGYFHDWGVLITLLLLGALAVFLISLGTRLLRLRLDPRLCTSRPPTTAFQSSFVLDLWWIVPVPEDRLDPVRRRGALPLIAIGLGVLVIMAALAAFAPLIVPGGDPAGPILLGPGTMNAPPRLALPGSSAWPFILGTDGTGKPVLNWVVYGARYSLLIGAAGALATVVLGTLLGILAAWSRPLGGIVSWLSRVILTVPPLPLLAVLIVFLAPSRGSVLVPLFAAVAWPATAATIRADFAAALRAGPAVAARALGATIPSILARHVLPALIRPFLRLVALTMGGILLTESALDAILPSPSVQHASWGTAMGAGLSEGAADWWLPLAAGLAVYLTVLALGLIERWLAPWRIYPLQHGARHTAFAPPPAGWPVGADMLCVRHLVPGRCQYRAPPRRSEPLG